MPLLSKHIDVRFNIPLLLSYPRIALASGLKSMFKATPEAKPDQPQRSACNKVTKNIAKAFGKWNPFSKRAMSVLFARELCPLTNTDPAP